MLNLLSCPVHKIMALFAQMRYSGIFDKFQVDRLKIQFKTLKICYNPPPTHTHTSQKANYFCSKHSSLRTSFLPAAVIPFVVVVVVVVGIGAETTFKPMYDVSLQ